MKNNAVTINRTFVFLALGLFLGSCTPKTPKVLERPLVAEEVRARVARESERKQRLSGVVKARMEGLKGIFASADLDVVVERTSKLHIAVRSFFDQPMQVFATDGLTMTIFDASEGAPVFYRGPVSGTSLSRLLPLEVWPHDLVNLFLASPPTQSSVAIKAIQTDGGTELSLKEPSGHLSVVSVGKNDRVERWQRFDEEGALLFDAVYEAFEEIDSGNSSGNLDFARKVRLVVPGEKEARVIFDFKELTLGAPPAAPAVFVLVIPEGYPVQPLP